MSAINEETIREAMPAAVQERLVGVVVKSGNVHLMLDIDGLAGAEAAAMRGECEAVARGVAGVLSATCITTSHNKESADEETPRKPPNREIPAVFERIKYVVAVASGKGGVGKSTIAVNLALALAQNNLQVGLLDADIYGPSAPQLLGITQRPETDDEKKLIPIIAHGVATMSIGYMVPPEQAMIWRGSMAQSALLQMLEDVAWQPLDVLVVDLPPGTGDIQLTMAQRMPIAGAVIVSTPAEIALADVRRAIAMFHKLEVPLLGLVNNMAYMEVNQRERLHPFGKKEGAAIAAENNIAHLCDIPLAPSLQLANDIGEPPLAEESDTPLAQIFAQLADDVLGKLKEA